MLESEPTNYQTSIIPGDGFPASPPEHFGSSPLDAKFGDTDDHSPVSPSLEVSEEYGVDDEEEEDSSSSSEDEDDEDDDEEDPVSANEDNVAEATVVAPRTPRHTTDNSRVKTRDVGTETPPDDRVAVPAVDQPSQVSILGGKYLLIANPPTPPTGTSTTPSLNATPPKSTQKCVHVETREQFVCRIVPRTMAGLNLLAAYHRLSDFSNSIHSIHEIILSPKSFYLIFPVNYGNVHAYLLAKKRLREDEAAHLFQQMVEAVKHCHSQGIVLRDLKLGKFVFTNKERTTIKLETLEDAVVLPEGGEDGLSDKHGCPNYVSPEKAEILRTNSKYPGKATDIWGLGVMLYTMLVGRYPFNDPDHGKLFVKIRRCHFMIPDCLSQNVKCVIRCLLRKDPVSRLSCDEILSHPWIAGQGNSENSSRTVQNLAMFYPPIANSQDFYARVTKRGLETTTDDSDDQVVPVWTPPTKTPKTDTDTDTFPTTY